MSTIEFSNEILRIARQKYSQKELAQLLEVTPRTIARWEQDSDAISGVRLLALQHLISQSNKIGLVRNFTFIDLFAGIGGTRLGFEAEGGKCLFTSEWDLQSQKTYTTNFHSDHSVNGDIREVDVDNIPDHDVLVGGFPCQPFSIAGVSKKNALGNPHGFACKTQGTLFFEIARIIESKRPRVFFLENVKNLKSHDKGRTFITIMQTLTQELGYFVSYRIIDAKRFLPQHRERIFIIGFRDFTDYQLFDINNISFPTQATTLKKILHPEDGTEKFEKPYTEGQMATVSAKYTLTDKLWDYLQRYAEKHRLAGNGFGFGLVGPDDVARTLSARYYKDGSEILIKQSKGKNPRRLTPRECARLMGFPDTYRIPVSDTQAYKQFGNSVAVPVISALAKPIAEIIGDSKFTGSNQ